MVELTRPRRLEGFGSVDRLETFSQTNTSQFLSGPVFTIVSASLPDPKHQEKEEDLRVHEAWSNGIASVLKLLRKAC